MTGIEQPPVVKKFDETNKEFSDVVLVVEDRKFYVGKLLLAFHSTYFKSLFFGHFEESKQSEIEIKDIDSEDFQNYLELIHGESTINNDTALGILNMADFFDSKSAMKRCEEFTVEVMKKMDVEIEELEKLVEEILSLINSAQDDPSILPPKNLEELDPAKLSNELKTLSLGN